MTHDIWRPADQFPLGRRIVISDPADEIPSSQSFRPFGLKYVTDPNIESGSLDFAAIDYDPERQIAITQDGTSVLSALRHTNNRTTTATAESDRNAPDKDSDVGGD